MDPKLHEFVLRLSAMLTADENEEYDTLVATQRRNSTYTELITCSKNKVRLLHLLAGMIHNLEAVFRQEAETHKSAIEIAEWLKQVGASLDYKLNIASPGPGVEIKSN